MGKRIWLGLTVLSEMEPMQVTPRMALKQVQMEDTGEMQPGAD